MALLLCAFVLCAAIPSVFAIRETDFQAVADAGAQSDNSVYVEQEPIFCTANMGLFFGEYAFYKDVLTGQYGLTDLHGKIVFSSEDIYPVGVLCKNVIVGTDSFSAAQFGQKGFLYDFAGNKLEGAESETFSIRDCGTLCDQGTGKVVGAWAVEAPMGFGEKPMYHWLIRMDGTATYVPFLYGAPWNGNCLTFNKETGRWGLMNLAGEEVLPQSYEYLYFLRADRLLARQNGSFSILTTSGATVETLSFDSIQPVNGVPSVAFVVGKDGKYGVCDENFSYRIPLEYDAIERYDTGYSFFLGTKGDRRYHISEDPARTYCGSPDFPMGAVVLGPDRYLIPDGDTRVLEDAQGQRLLPDGVESCYLYDNCFGGENLLLQLQGSENVKLFDKELNVLLEFPANTYTVYGCNDLLVLTRRTNENGQRTTAIYDKNGQQLASYSGVCVELFDKYGMVLQRDDGLMAFSDHRGVLRTGYEFRWAEQVSSGSEELSYPFYIACPAGTTNTYVMIDARTGKNAIYENAVVSDAACILREGSYFAFYENDKTGFARLTAREESPFRDVRLNAWYAQAAKFCYNAGLMVGTGSGSFSPKATATRAMLVTMLYKLSGEPSPSYGFSDVRKGKWYTDPVNWAAANGIVAGKTPTTFCPNDPVTREQLVAILYKYAAGFAPQTADRSVLAPYQDAKRISAYAKDAMAWAVANGFVSGKTATTLDPKGNATRAEIAVILMHVVQYMAEQMREIGN